MTALTLTLREQPRQCIDMSPLTPDQLANKSTREVRLIKLWQGKFQHSVDELFEISGKDPTKIIFRNTNDRLIRIGAELKHGEIVIEGDCGAYIGERMRAGQITVQGNCTDYAACEMAGGELEIQGDAGHFVGSARAGERKGMSGGQMVIRGNTGDRLGDLQRRGVILVQGNAGDYCASRMIAGTIVILGNTGEHTGFGMRRGTVLLGGKSESFPISFSKSNHVELGFLNLLKNNIQQVGGDFSDFISSSFKKRLVGDLAFGGQGEIFIP